MSSRASSPTWSTLLIGVDDAGVVRGLDCDYTSLGKVGKDDGDLFLFLLHLHQVIDNAVGTVGDATRAITDPAELERFKVQVWG